MYYWLCLLNHPRRSIPNIVSTLKKGGGGVKSDLQSVARGKFKGAVRLMPPWITMKSVPLGADTTIEKHVYLKVNRHYPVRWRRQHTQEKQNNALICCTLEVGIGCWCRGSLGLPWDRDQSSRGLMIHASWRQIKKKNKKLKTLLALATRNKTAAIKHSDSYRQLYGSHQGEFTGSSLCIQTQTRSTTALC